MPPYSPSIYNFSLSQSVSHGQPLLKDQALFLSCQLNEQIKTHVQTIRIPPAGLDGEQPSCHSLSSQTFMLMLTSS